MEVLTTDFVVIVVFVYFCFFIICYFLHFAMAIDTMNNVDSYVCGHLILLFLLLLLYSQQLESGSLLVGYSTTGLKHMVQLTLALTLTNVSRLSRSV